MSSWILPPLTAGLMLATGLSAQPTYTNLGRGTASGVSNDGRVVVGSDFFGPYRWETGVFTPLTEIYRTEVVGVSGDGNVIVGNEYSSGPKVAATFTNPLGWNPIGFLPYALQCPSLSSAYDANSDGSVIVGLSWLGCQGRAFRWDAVNGMLDLGTSRASTISGDGQTIGGFENHPMFGVRRALAWLDGSMAPTILLLGQPGNPEGYGEVWDINHDGSVLVGWGVDSVGPYPYRWTPAGGVERLPVAGAGPRARATTADGSMIAGEGGDPPQFPGAAPAFAWVWTEEDGTQGAESFLITQGVTVPPGPSITFIAEVSPDGKFIVGQRGSFLSLNDEGFYVELGEGRKYGVNAAPANTLDLVGGGSSQIGQTFVATTSNLTVPAVALVISTGHSFLPWLGGAFLVDLTPPILFVSAGASGGVANVPLPIPNNPALAGQSLYLQSVAPDAVLPFGAALSNGLKMTLRQ